MSDPTRKRSQADSPGLRPLRGQGDLPDFSDAADAEMAPDVQANGRAVSNGRAEDPPGAAEDSTTIVTPPIAEPSLRSRIDPASLVVDWDIEGLAEEDNKGPDAKWGRPPKDNFVRAHPTWTTGVNVLDCRDSQGIGAEYILARDVAQRVTERGDAVAATQIYLLVDRDGVYRFWPVKLGDPTEQQKPMDHVKTAKAAIAQARQGWVKITWQSRKGGNGWRTRAARAEIPDPVWPEDPLALFLDTVSDRYIDNPYDPIILNYLGDA